MKTRKDTLTTSDWKKWGMNVLIFSSPTILAFLIALQGAFVDGELPTKQHLMFAFGAAYSAFIAALIDLFKKYKAS